MKNVSLLIAGLASSVLLTACTEPFEGVRRYQQSPDTVIATAYDAGRDKGRLEEGKAAIAYDPDGCQGWLIDDGIEGYSGRRFDPVTGLPVCNNHYPPGTVVKDYQSQSPGLEDYVPRPGKKKRKVN